MVHPVLAGIKAAADKFLSFLLQLTSPMYISDRTYGKPVAITIKPLSIFA